MGATYTRQSSFTDGDVITADLFNNEYDQLLAAFAASTGHTHDGTAAEGGPITKLLGTSITIGDATSGTDITVTFDGETNDGVFKWMEDEDYFEFSDDLLIASTEKIQFRDTAIYINSSTDGQLDIVADSEIQIAATTIDINGNVDISGTLTIGGAGISEAELEILDGATVTTTEINILDGDTTASSTTVADADRVVFNDAGTMKQVAVTDLAAYFDDEITAMPNLVTTAATTVGALNSGSITSGFGTIDTGSSTITTTGLISGGSLDIDDVLINGTTIGHTDDTDLITLANGVVTVAGEVSMTTLDIGGTNVTSTAAELNIVDGGTSATATTVADADRVVMNDNGTMVQVAVTDLAAYFDDEITAMPNLVTTGALNSGSITSGFGTINTGSSNITTTGVGAFGSLDISGDIDVDGTTNLDVVDIDGAVDMASTLQVDGAITSSSGATITTADNSDNLTLTSTDADASAGPNLNLFRNSASPADSDFLGNIKFNGRNDNSQDVQYAEIEVYAMDVSDGAEDALYNLNVMTSGTNTSYMQVRGEIGQIVFNEDSQDIDFRIESNNHQRMFFVDAAEDKVFIGHGTTHQYDAFGAEIILQIEAAGTAPYAGIGMIQNSNDTDSAPLIFGKSRGTSTGSTTIVQDGDLLGRIEFQGMDGSDLETGASIFGAVDGTPGSDDMPGRLVFNTTADGANSATERMRINSSGNVGIGTNTPSSYTANGNNLVVADVNVGITLASTSASGSGALYFADGTTGSEAYRGIINYLHASDAMGFHTGAAERMRIDSSGHLLINNTAYSANGTLVVQQTADSKGVAIIDSGAANTFFLENEGTMNRIRNNATVPIAFETNSAERMRLDSSGNLLVGTTNATIVGNGGIGLKSNGRIDASTNGGSTMLLERRTNDGDIAAFYKDGSVVGTIGSNSGYLYIGSNEGNDAFLLFGADIVSPATSAGANRDNAIDLGHSSARFDDIFATNGTIQTSDRNEKQDIASLTSAEMLVAKRISALFKTFRWKDKVAEKGGNARTHTGIIAQDVQAAFSAEGLDASRYALWCSDTWTNDDGSEQTRMGVRYPELLSFLSAYNEQRFTDIEARITALEGA